MSPCYLCDSFLLLSTHLPCSSHTDHPATPQTWQTCFLVGFVSVFCSWSVHSIYMCMLALHPGRGGCLTYFMLLVTHHLFIRKFSRAALLSTHIIFYFWQLDIPKCLAHKSLSFLWASRYSSLDNKNNTAADIDWSKLSEGEHMGFLILETLLWWFFHTDRVVTLCYHKRSRFIRILITKWRKGTLKKIFRSSFPVCLIFSVHTYTHTQVPTHPSDGFGTWFAVLTLNVVGTVSLENLLSCPSILSH